MQMVTPLSQSYCEGDMKHCLYCPWQVTVTCSCHPIVINVIHHNKHMKPIADLQCLLILPFPHFVPSSKSHLFSQVGLESYLPLTSLFLCRTHRLCSTLCLSCYCLLPCLLTFSSICLFSPLKVLEGKNLPHPVLVLSVLYQVESI